MPDMKVLKTYHYIIFVLCLLLCCNLQCINAQEAAVIENGADKKFIPSPQKAAMLSAVFPGMGQVYNRKYWKMPIVYAGFVGLGLGVSYNTSKYNMYIKAFQDFTDEIPETNSYLGIAPWDARLYDPVLYPDSYNPSMEASLKEALLLKVDQFRKDRDLSFIGIAAWYLLSILDANVDASLFDYDIDKNLDLTITPLPVNIGSYITTGVNIGMKINF
jgi:hypothetical protein